MNRYSSSQFSPTTQLTKNKNKTVLLKAGGSILHQESLVTSLCADIKRIIAAGWNVILVHGGSQAINKALTQHGIQSEFVDGLRVTSTAAMNIIEMVLCGQVNQSLVRKLNSFGLHAIGLSGADQQMLLSTYYNDTHGCVGEINTVNTAIIDHLLSFKKEQSPLIPVIATIGVDKKGNALNINADLAACHLAKALKVDQLIYLTDQDGIYDQQGHIFSHLSEKNLQTLINQSVVKGGMLVKAKAVLASLKAGLDQIMILNGNQKQIVFEALVNGKRVGTLCGKNETL